MTVFERSEQLTLSTKCLNELTRGLMFKTKPLTLFMFSYDF